MQVGPGEAGLQDRWHSCLNDLWEQGAVAIATGVVEQLEAPLVLADITPSLSVRPP